jgi:hypothetical protein
MVLAGLLSASAAALIPWALAEPVANAGEGAFLGVSAMLVGRQVLDPVLAKRLPDALVAQDAAFPANVRALLALINAQGLQAAGLQRDALDAAQSPLAACRARSPAPGTWASSARARRPSASPTSRR